MHLQRKRRGADMDPVSWFERPLEERIWGAVDVRGPDECWPWKLSGSPRGYGQVTLGGRSRRVTRVIYEMLHGPIPAGMVVCHSCDNPPCCNPAHLWLGTVAQNNADRAAKGRSWSPVGERQGASKLTAADVLAIRADGRSQSVIAGEYGITQSNVSAIKLRKSWTHL
jgi:hypothetical protein